MLQISPFQLPNYQLTQLRNPLQSVPFIPLSLVRLLQVFAGFVERALGVVAGLDSLAVFVHRT